MINPKNNGSPYHITGADKAGLWIFGIAVGIRTLMQFAPHAPGAMIDYAWVTNFAAIAAGWLSIRSRVGDSSNTMDRVENQTNGSSTSPEDLEERMEAVVRRVLSDTQKGQGY
jgi:hypothetical protein